MKNHQQARCAFNRKLKEAGFENIQQLFEKIPTEQRHHALKTIKELIKQGDIKPILSTFPTNQEKVNAIDILYEPHKGNPLTNQDPFQITLSELNEVVEFTTISQYDRTYTSLFASN